MTKAINSAPTRSQIIIRVSKHSLSFSAPSTDVADSLPQYEPYAVKNGISMAANLREAFKTSALLGVPFSKALVMVAAPVLLVPVSCFDETMSEALYDHSFGGHDGQLVMCNLLSELNVVALYAVSRDFCTVLADHYVEVRYCCAMQPVWSYLHQRSLIGKRNKLYGYFHDGSLDVCSFSQNRFKFCNSFDITSSSGSGGNAHDALYFLLCVWKQLGLKAEWDELHLMGDIPERDWLLDELRQYLQRAYIVNPAGDFNRAPITRIAGMPFDLVTAFVHRQRLR